MTDSTLVEPQNTEEKEKRFPILRGFIRGMVLGVMLIGVFLILITIVIPRVIGAVPLTVLTGSMEPTFNPGDLIVTMPIAKKEINRGDIITFQPKSGDPMLITHRVVSVGFALNGNKILVTKGDANDAPDDPIITDQVKGKLLYHVPYLGYLANAVPSTNKPLIMQILGFGFFAWAAFLVARGLVGKKRKKKRDAKIQAGLTTENPFDKSSSSVNSSVVEITPVRDSEV